ncbi:hypothetical protein COOONC_05876 [Cooperia oncophora]
MHEAMHICCSARPPRAATVPKEKAVCPASHPVISNDRQHLRLCSDCEDGICAPFRSSSVSICCHSSTTFCGPGSSVEMDGLLARDCAKVPCSEGYECSLSPFGSRVCCSLAECSSGKRARAICAGGCRKDEKCETIYGQRWCCPIVVPKRCPDNRASNGATCSQFSRECSAGYECEESDDQSGYLCCEIVEPSAQVPCAARARTFTKSPPTTLIPPAEVLSIAAIPITSPMVVFPPSPTISLSEPKCYGDAVPMLMDGEFLRCPQIGAPCPKAGYACQATLNGLYCCPMEEVFHETSTLQTIISSSDAPEKCTDCDNRNVEQPPPTCPFAFREARHETSDEIKTCTGFLDFT